MPTKTKTHNGIIDRVNLERGFGFIRRVGVEADLFFHHRDLTGGLQFDEQLKERRVKFEIEAGTRGPKAARVRPID